jgi:hypothetical protein
MTQRFSCSIDTRNGPTFVTMVDLCTTFDIRLPITYNEIANNAIGKLAVWLADYLAGRLSVLKPK